MKFRSRRLAAAVIALAVVGVACGDDDPDQKAQAGKEAPTKEAFIAAADEICASANEQIDPIFGALFTGEPDPAQVQESLGQVLTINEQTLEEVRALEVPAGDAERLEELWDLSEATFTDLRTKIATPDGAMELLQGDDPFEAVNEELAGYGFADCAGEGEREQETEVFGGDELSAAELASATKVTIKGVDYGYEGVPASIAAGPAVLTFENVGADFHEIGLVKVKAGATVEQVLERAKVDEQDMEFIDRFIGAAMALPGDSIDFNVKLDPGTYGFACFVEDAAGVRHIDHGMFGSFTVAG